MAKFVSDGVSNRKSGVLIETAASVTLTHTGDMSEPQRFTRSIGITTNISPAKSISHYHEIVGIYYYTSRGKCETDRAIML